MHSDGLLSRWDLQLYPTLAQRHPSLIAAVLYRDYNRNRDDVTVLVAKSARSLARERSMAYAITSVLVRHEPDVVAARQRTRQIASALGFDSQDQTRLATGGSPSSRATPYGYAGGGKIEFMIEGQTTPQSDADSGQRQRTGHRQSRGDSRRALSFEHRHGAIGIIGARRLVDQCDIQTAPGNREPRSSSKMLPHRAPLRDAPRGLTKSSARSPVQRRPEKRLR